ncbi:hypothetical protein GCM10011575_00120 [Microlunatus endophyticus]|uniref:Uncharacterized protein n=1 Tax=Microlunatus endophyticus TaxID=1716077 RepID=A0A917RZ56_9ACTN|nr:hypothetical protein [Microlunatus endophyticus]GGL46157.1 hypothetical protein GCM10011575_00120 [Microlunatus endophyticus]
MNVTKNLNVHPIALQVPITDLTHNGHRPKGVTDPLATIGNPLFQGGRGADGAEGLLEHPGPAHDSRRPEQVRLNKSA